MVRIAIAFFLLGAISFAHARTDTLRNYVRGGSYMYYRDPEILLQAARFDLAGPGNIVEIRATLVGTNARGEARLRLFGPEGGAPAPFSRCDLVPPIMLRKSRSGPEAVTARLPRPVPIDGNQIFIGFDRFSPGVALASDRRRHAPKCVGATDRYCGQIVGKSDGTWEWGVYEYIVDVIVEYDNVGARGAGFVDITADAMVPDSELVNSGIAWCDIDNDGRLDVLAGGHLYRADGAGKFVDVTADAHIVRRPVLQAFIDVDNNGDQDILSLSDTVGENAVISRNDGFGRFIAHPFSLPNLGRPLCFSIADVNGDFYPDIFVGQRADSARGLGAAVLYLGDGAGGFRADTASRTVVGTGIREVDACQMLDLDSNGRVDLYFVGDGRGYIAWNIGSPNARPASPFGSTTAGGTRIVGCDWADGDGDGRPDLFAPMRFEGPQPAAGMEKGSVRPAIVGTAASRLVGGRIPAGYELSGGAWGDIDNDGAPDIVTAASCRCSFVELYRQTEPGRFERETSRLGLGRVSGGPDVVWVDYDNDGRLDLSMISDGRLRLYRNTIPAASNAQVTLDLDDPAGMRLPIGAHVEVFAGGKRHVADLGSGRGLGVQDPLRLHIGLGDARSIDSVTVRWPNSNTRTLHTDVVAGRLNTLSSGRARSAAASASVAAYPNPFTDRLTFTYRIAARGHVRLALYSAEGRLVSVVVDADMAPGEYTATWSPTTTESTRLSQGVYVYRLTSGSDEVAGKAVLQR